MHECEHVAGIAKMAEMTAQEAVIWVEQQAYMAHTHNAPEISLGLQQIAALIRQQAAEIERIETRLKNCIGPIENKAMLDEIAQQVTEISTLRDSLDRQTETANGLASEVERLQEENKALRCCGNCYYEDHTCCQRCKDYSEWEAVR